MSPVSSGGGPVEPVARDRAALGVYHFTLIFAGLGAGVVAAGFAARAVSSRLFGVSPTDITTFAFAIAVMLLTGLVALLLPARRATLVDPAKTLRYE